MPWGRRWPVGNGPSGFAAQRLGCSPRRGLAAAHMAQQRHVQETNAGACGIRVGEAGCRRTSPARSREPWRGKTGQKSDTREPPFGDTSMLSKDARVMACRSEPRAWEGVSPRSFVANEAGQGGPVPRCAAPLAAVEPSAEEPSGDDTAPSHSGRSDKGLGVLASPRGTVAPTPPALLSMCAKLATGAVLRGLAASPPSS